MQNHYILFAKQVYLFLVIFIHYEVIYFNSFGVERNPKEIKKSIGNKNIKTNIFSKTNIFRIQAYDSKMSGYFCITFIMFNIKRLINFTSLYSKNELKKKNDKKY